MPHLRIRALEPEQVQQLSQKLLPELAEATGTPVDHFTLEHIPSRFFAAGEEAKGDPFCEVLWFDRGQEAQDLVARLITARLKGLEPKRDAVVVFGLYQKTGSYENGVHF